MSSAAREQRNALLAPGISHALARWRFARYLDVRYRVDGSITKGATRFTAGVTIILTLDRRCDIILDWLPIAGASFGTMRVNGMSCSPRFANEHLIVPAASTRPGENRVELRVRAPIGVNGSALIRYTDRETGDAYVYTLCVPADARTLFPCFDQPDLKARFALRLAAPAHWKIVANAPQVGERAMLGRARRRVEFAWTEPISTYLFAFAAGPFAVIREPGAACRLFVRRSQARRARQAGRTALRLNRAVMRYLSDYTARPFPFAKYDLVLIPEFAFNGMEHAGATFLREQAILLARDAPAPETAKRANLIFHETAHQWFGNLVTMRWFDDLWIKEAFANWLAARAASVLTPSHPTWLAFALLKASAYQTDLTAGTTALWQRLDNLADAKSLYGNIVYGKGPAVLHQLAYALGERVFRRGVRQFVARHAYASADWRDLIDAIGAAARRDLTAWSDAWIRRAGTPILYARLHLDAQDHVRACVIAQALSRGGAATWPQKVRLALEETRGGVRVAEVRIVGARTQVPSFRGFPMPRRVLINDGDHAYTVVVADPLEADRSIPDPASVVDPLRRWLIWSARWEAVRSAARAPAGFVRDLMHALPREREPLIVAALLDRVQVAFRRFCPSQAQSTLSGGLEAALLESMEIARRNQQPGLATSYRRAFIAVASTRPACARLTRWASSRAVPLDDRYRAVQRLFVMAAPTASGLLRSLARADQSREAARLAFACGATAKEAKARYFDAFMHDARLPESWIEEALAPFNAVEQAVHTLPFLGHALHELPRLKRERRIFFVNRWLAAFIGGQSSAAAARIVRESARELPLDLRRKTLEAAHELNCAVRIRKRWKRDAINLPKGA